MSPLMGLFLKLSAGMAESSDHTWGWGALVAPAAG